MTLLSKLAGAILVATSGFASVYAQTGPNLIQDASFESGLRPWFAEHSGGGGQAYYIGFQKTKDAPDGNSVLNVQGWRDKGWSRILSPVLALSGTSYSATIKARCTGENPATVELAIFSAKEGYNAKTKLLSFVSQILKPRDGWVTLSGLDKALPAGITNGQFAIIVSGNQHSTQVDLDEAGLFAGPALGSTKNNVETFTWPAYTLANGKGWIAQPAFYYDRALGAQELLNTGPKTTEPGEAVVTAQIAQAGLHTLWVRCARAGYSLETGSNLTIELRQGGVVLGSQQIADKSPDGTNSVVTTGWVSVSAKLAEGPVEVALRNPSGKYSMRRIDYLVLTNYGNYTPIAQDFATQGYIRFTNHSDGPYCLWVRAAFGTGILDHSGFHFDGIHVNNDKDVWIAPGESSPWIRVTDNMAFHTSPNFSFLATCESWLAGFYNGRFTGDLDFAYGEDHTITKTIHVDQAAPRLIMTIPYDFKNLSDKILTGLDHLKDSQEAVDPLPVPKLARRILILAGINLNAGLDDPALVDGEIDVVKKLGMNSLYESITTPDKNKAFAEAHGLVPVIRLWSASLYYNGTKAELDVAKITANAERGAKMFEGVLDQVNLVNFADEPYGQNWKELLKSPDAPKFVTYLKDHGITLEQLGLKSWDEAVVVGPDEKNDKPVLFYYSGLYRLQIFNDEITLANGIYHKYFPQTTLAYANLEPTYGATEDQIGYDLFGLIRTGGPDLIWSEDWSGYGVSVQQTSDYLALLGSINRTAHKPIGGYCVAQGLAQLNPVIARIKAYTWLAGGATWLDWYNYGPAYIGNDAWSYNRKVYPAINSVGVDAGILDGAMENLKPRPSAVAIFYNRTAGIWDDYAKLTEPDSRYIQWALADSGYAPEFVCEDEVDEGILSHYKILYLGGVELRGKTADNIAKWVHDGGTLIGTAGVGAKNEFSRPQAILDPVFGVQSEGLDFIKPSTSKVPDTLTTTQAYPNPELKLERVNVTEKLTLLPSSEAKPVLTDLTGGTAGVLNMYGSGKAIRLAFLPGITFLHEATAGKKFENYLPQEYRPEVARLISWPATLAGVPPEGQVTSAAPLATLKRWDSEEGTTPGRSVVFVIDYSGKPNPDFSMALPDAAHFTHIHTAHGAKVTVTPGASGLTQIAFPLDAADAVILEK